MLCSKRGRRLSMDQSLAHCGSTLLTAMQQSTTKQYERDIVLRPCKCIIAVLDAQSRSLLINQGE